MKRVSQEHLIARGRTAEVYDFPGDHVLKLFYGWCPPSWVEREIEAARIVSALNLATPKFVEALEIDGRQGIVYEKVEGRAMLSVLRSKPWQVWKLAREFAELHSAVHRKDGAGLPA